MGRYFDTSGYPGEKSALDLSTGLSSLGDALTDVLNRRQKAQQFQQQLDFEREDAARKLQQNAANDAYQNRIIDQREHRDELTFNQQQAERQQRATEAAAKAMSEGNPEMAKAILHGTVSYDPATGQETGRGELVPGQTRDVGPAPQQPQAPPAAQPVPPEIAARRRGRTNTSEDEDANFYQSEGRPMPPQTGVDPLHPEPPVITDDGRPPSPALMRDYDPSVQSARYQDTSDALAEQQARIDAQGHDQAQSAFESASAAYPQARAEYEARLRAAQGEQPFTIRFGKNDPGVQISPEALRYGRRHAAADDFAASIRGLSLDERGKRNAASALAALEYGRDPQAVYAAFDRAQETGQKFEDTIALQTKKDAAAKERALIAGPRNPGDFHVGQLHESQEAGTVRDTKAWQEDFKDFERQAGGIPFESKSYQRLVTAVKNINSGNSELQRDAQSTLVSAFSGGGVVRKFEQEFLMSHLAGLGASGQTAMQHIIDGKMGPEDLAVTAEAARRALQERHDRADQLYQSIVRGFGPGTGHDYFGGNIDAKVRATLGPLGYDAPPMYPNTPPVQLGDIARPYRSQLGRHEAPPPAPRAAPGPPPEIGARRRGKSASDLDAAMQ